MLEEYYNCYAEDGRLQKDNAHGVEYRTSIHYLKQNLPQGCSILDACAGTGVYAFALAKIGYRVTAGDLVKKHVNMMNSSENRKFLEAVYQGNILNMAQFTDSSFDSVLCMGALYHLQTEKEQEKAVFECLRVLKSGGVFAFAYINRNAIAVNHFMQNPAHLNDVMNILQYGKNGIFYGMGFGEADRLASKFPLEKITNIGTDGLIYPLKEEINSLSQEQFEEYLRYHFTTCEQPSIIGHSMHGLYIGRKK